MQLRYSAIAAVLLAALGASAPAQTLADRQPVLQRSRGGYQEPAYARGYADGYRRGFDDGRNHERYDPAGSREYRDGDTGYDVSYGGSRDAYRNNYRAGFRQGYEDGYRAGSR